MKIVCREPSLRRAAGPGFILLGLITLLLLPATARGQFGGGRGFPLPASGDSRGKPAESHPTGPPVAGAWPGKPRERPGETLCPAGPAQGFKAGGR